MRRTPEPELMDDPIQARAYAGADFAEAHEQILRVFDMEFPGVDLRGKILDLGCGPGDITFRFAYRFPHARIFGVDGSAAMLKLAEERKARTPDVAERITFIKGLIPGAPIPSPPYDAIVTNSLLHHIHTPGLLWDTVIEYARPGTIVYVGDLFRPATKSDAKRMVDKYAAVEPEVLQRDFYKSLLAAFSPEEIEGQIREAGLLELRIKKISDRHLIVYGVKG